MPRVGFEPTIPIFERAKTAHALDRSAAVIGILTSYHPEILILLEILNMKMYLRFNYFLSKKGHQLCDQIKYNLNFRLRASEDLFQLAMSVSS
jgi:hypothetical protein